MKKIIGFILCTIFLFLSVYLIYTYIKPDKLKKPEEKIITEEKIEKNIVKDLRNEYSNNDVVGLLEIPNILSVPVVKGKDNSYYLTHNTYNQLDEKGTIYMDYRVEPNLDKKVIIYGHLGYDEDLPFANLSKYKNENFYNNNKEIYLYTETGKKTYQIFSAYIEDSDFDYVNLTDFNGLTWEEHLSKLKNKSTYDTKVEVNNSSKIIILQTSILDMNFSETQKYQLVLGVLK